MTDVRRQELALGGILLAEILLFAAIAPNFASAGMPRKSCGSAWSRALRSR